MYTINIGQYKQYETRCLSASFGGSGISSEVIPWQDTEYNPWDYKYENGEFILDVIPIEVDYTVEINKLKQYLKDTDYKVLKYIDGLITDEEYAVIKADRQAKRARINELEAMLETVEIEETVETVEIEETVETVETESEVNEDVGNI